MSQASSSFLSAPSRRHLLLVEDSEADTLLAQLSLESSASSCCLHVVHDGVEALDFLRQGTGYRSAPRPQLILLDLHLPRLDGFELLALLRGDPDLALIPVMVLLGSPLDLDGLERQGVRASGYLVKPLDFGGVDDWLTSCA